MYQASGILAEAEAAKAIQDHQDSGGAATAGLSIDLTTKHSVISMVRRFCCQIGICHWGSAETASKSTLHQLKANQRLRANVAESGVDVYGLLPQLANPALATGVGLRDGGPAEAKFFSEELPKERKELFRQGGLAEDEAEKESAMADLRCHKHHTSNITKDTATKALQVASQSNRDPYELLRLVAKGLRMRSKWGHTQGGRFNTFCEKKGQPNFVEKITPIKGTRHHLQSRSMVWLFLARHLIIEFIKKGAPKARRGTNVASGQRQSNALLRCDSSSRVSQL